MQSAHTPNLEALIFDELQEIFLLLETVPVNEMEKIIFLIDKVNNDSYQKLKKRNAGSISDETEIKLNQLLINNKTDRLYGLFQKYGRSGEDDRLGADEILTLMSYFSKKYIKENSIDLEKIHRVLEELDNFLSKNQLYNYGVTVLFSVIKLIKKEGLNTP